MFLRLYLAFVGVLVALVMGGVVYHAIAGHAHRITSVTQTHCAEDDPCWNCATMGNHVCGNRP